MECVDEDAPAPPDLELAWQCERWHCLPDGPSLYEQDAQTMYRMAVLSNIYGSLSRLRNAHGEQIHYLSDQDRNILGTLKRLGFIFNG